MRIPWSRTIEARYRGRSPLALLRVRAMLLTYVVGVVGGVVMVTHDLVFALSNRWVHVANSGAITVTLAGCVWLLVRGRERLAAHGVIVVTLLFSVMAIVDRGGGVPDEYYDTFARWFPVFIVGAMLFAPTSTALAVVTLTVALNLGYYFAFCRALPGARPEVALADAIEMSVINVVIGAMAVGSVRMVRGAFAAAQREADNNRALADELEDRVSARTRELGGALAERQAILDNLMDGLVTIDASGERVEVANEAFRRLYGLSDALEGAARDALAPDLVALVERAAASDDVATGPVALPDDRLGRAAVIGFAAEDGTHLGVIAVVRDVTLETEVDRMKTELLSTVSHELRTPLTSVLGFAQIIGNRLEKRVFAHVPEDDARAQRAVEQVRTNVGIIVEEGTRLTNLINDVLDISKMEAGRMEYRREPVEVARLVERASAAVRSLFGAGGPALVLEVDEDLAPVIGDEERLVQVLVNLLSNARKFTDEGTITLAATREGAEVELSVTDTGVGIPEEMQPKVFEKFRQVGDTLGDRSRGTGLGLPICVQIVRAHGGEITLESAVGEGSRFSFRLAL